MIYLKGYNESESINWWQEVFENLLECIIEIEDDNEFEVNYYIGTHNKKSGFYRSNYSVRTNSKEFKNVLVNPTFIENINNSLVDKFVSTKNCVLYAKIDIFIPYTNINYLDENDIPFDFFEKVSNNVARLKNDWNIYMDMQNHIKNKCVNLTLFYK